MTKSNVQAIRARAVSSLQRSHSVDPSVDDRLPETIPAADCEMVATGLAQAERGEFASEDEVRATFSRFRL